MYIIVYNFSNLSSNSNAINVTNIANNNNIVINNIINDSNNISFIMCNVSGNVYNIINNDNKSVKLNTYEPLYRGLNVRSYNILWYDIR